MTEHSQNKPRGILRGLGGDIAALRYAQTRRAEAVERRDFDREARANELYEELRTLNREELARRAGWDAPRQQLIGAIIREELQ